MTMRPDRSGSAIRLVTLALVLLGLGWPATAQFAPATGPVGTPIFTSAAPSGTQGPFTVTRSGQTITVARPGLGNFIYTAPGGDPSRTLEFAFVGTSGLLLQTIESNPVDVRITLDFINMATIPVSTPATGIYAVQQFVTQNPNPQLFINSDSSVFFTKLVLADAAINDVFQIAVHRSDTGASICGMMPVDRQSGDTIVAEITGTDAIITWNRPSFTDVVSGCSLPAADLDVAPDPLAFGEILSTANDTAIATLENTGTDVITVSAIAAAGVFTPMGFVAQTLDPGETLPVTISFNPAGVVGTFDEQLPITRTPAVGAGFIRCTGSSRAPAAVLTVNPLNINFGTVNVGAAPTANFSIDNTGDIPLTINAITAPGVAEFTRAIPAAVVLPRVLNPADPPITITVTFTPAASMPYNSSITVNATSANPATLTRTVNLAGVGHIPAADFQIDPTLTMLNYGEVEVGYRFGKGVRIVNGGDLDLQFDVEVLGDTRFSFTDTPDVPGTGGRNGTITIPASPIGGPFNQQILRVTFDAALPVGGPFTGTLRLSNIVNDPTPPAQPIDVALSGTVIAGKTLDVGLVLDRSGSMAEPMLVGTKEQAVRRAARLFFELMRADVGDRAALIQFNTAVDLLQPRTDITTASRATFIGEVNDTANLVPSGATSISAGLLESFNQLNDPGRDVRAALIVTDGKENQPATLPGGQQVDLTNIVVPAGVGIHSLCLGTAANTDLARLTDIAQRSGGTAMASDDVTQLGVFDVEKYFLQVATTILGGTTTLDPVATLQRGERHTWQVELIPADKSVTFCLMFKDGVLPYFVEAPDGTVYPTGVPPAGFGQATSEPPQARILRVQLPTDEPERYSGLWQIHVMHTGKLLHGEGDHRDSKDFRDPVDYALAVSVFSNLRLLALLSPQPIYPGDPITVTAFLTEEETRVRGATIDVNVRFPDTVTTRTLQLFDDGAHNDGAANDGEYADDFNETNQTGAYSFMYHAVGSSARGGSFVRETTQSQFVVPRDSGEDPPTPGSGGGGIGGADECCSKLVSWLRILAIIGIIIILLLLWRVFWWRSTARAVIRNP